MEAWLSDPLRDKPLLIHGPPQTGKKTRVRAVLRNGGYTVIEPGNSTEDNWKLYAERGFSGPQAFLMSVAETGMRSLPASVGRAPVVYVCNNPYNHGRKADLEKRFVILELQPTQPIAKGNPVDTELKPWELMDRVGAPPKLNLGVMLRAIELGPDPAMLEHLIYWNTCQALGEGDIDLAQRCVELQSWADVTRYKVPEELQNTLAIIAPIRSRKMHQIRPMLFKDPIEITKKKDKPAAPKHVAVKPAAKRARKS